MRVQDVMTEAVKTIAPTAAAEDACSLMRLHGIHHLVVTKANRVVGVLSDRDAGGRRGAAIRVNSSAADLMTAPAVTVEPTTTVRQAANVMRSRSISCLVVVGSGHVTGIVIVSDLLALVGSGLDRGAVKSKRWRLGHRAPHRNQEDCRCLVTANRLTGVAAQECPMLTYVERFVERLRDAEDDLRDEVHEQQRPWRYHVHRGRVWFDRELRESHRHLRQSIPAYILQGNLLSLLTAPIVYSLLLPFVLLDLWVTLYQQVCFPIYGMPRVPRRRYFTVDRHKLAYLNGIEKVNCTFCSYANGLIAYVREVAGRTEQYWCPIKHARAIPTPHQRYHVFFDYGDAQRYRKELPALRRALRRPNHHAAGHRSKRGGHDHGAR